MRTTPTDDEQRTEGAPPKAVMLTVAYHGGAFFGFAPQREGRTVYGVLLEAVRKLDAGVERLRGSSRTDSGVHARGQLIVFDPHRHIAPRGWGLGLNSNLPADVAVRRVRTVAVGLDPRSCGRWKRYRYFLRADVARDPLGDSTAWRIGDRLDLDAARTAAAALVGTHDFAAFRTAHDPRVYTVRTIHEVSVHQGVGGDPHLVSVDVVGSGFLHNMVRIIVGTMVDVARGRLPASVMATALGTRNRRDLGVTAPPQGLVLDEVRLDLPDVTGAEESWP